MSSVSRLDRAVGQVYHAFWGAKAHHVEEMAGQRNDFKAPGQRLSGQGLNLAVLGHQKLVPKFLAGETAIQKGGLQHWVTGKGSLDARRIYLAPGLGLQVFVAADVVGVGMGIVYGGQPPAIGRKNLAHLFPSVLIVAAIDEADLFRAQPHQPDFGWTLDVVTVASHLYQFVHALRPLFHRPRRVGSRSRLAWPHYTMPLHALQGSDRLSGHSPFPRAARNGAGPLPESWDLLGKRSPFSEGVPLNLEFRGTPRPGP